MAIDTQKYSERMDREARHSALAEFSRDERRPAVLLLSALLIAVLFFTIGLLVGRWTAAPNLVASGETSTASAAPAVSAGTLPQSATPSATNAADESAPGIERRFALLVATYDAPEKAQPLIKALQEAGYTDVRTTSPRANEVRPRYTILVGHYTRDEALEAVRRLRSASDTRLKNAKIIQDQ